MLRAILFNLLLAFSALLTVASIAVTLAGHEEEWSSAAAFGLLTAFLTIVGPLSDRLQSRNKGRDEILSAFPAEQTLISNRWKSLSFVAVAAGFATLAVVSSFSEQADTAGNGNMLLFGFSICLIGFALNLARVVYPSRLTFSLNGLKLDAVLAKWEITWQEVENFQAKQFGYPTISGKRSLPYFITFNKAGEPKTSLEVAKQIALGMFVQRRGRIGVLRNSYDISDADLAALLTAWRERTLAAKRA